MPAGIHQAVPTVISIGYSMPAAAKPPGPGSTTVRSGYGYGPNQAA